MVQYRIKKSYSKDKTPHPVFRKSGTIFILNRWGITAKISLNFKSFLATVNNSLSTNSQYFWKFIKDNYKCDAIPQEKVFNQETAKDGNAISNLFAVFFSNMKNALGI